MDTYPSTNNMPGSEGGSSSQSHQRLRTKNACEPCRSRKRKCNGEEPCPSCSRYGYECHYGTPDDSPVRKKVYLSNNTKTKGSRTGTTNSAPPSHDTDHVSPARSAEDGILDPVSRRFSAASSGVAFPRILGINIDAKDDTPRLHSFAWNVGIRNEPPVTHTDVRHLVSYDVLKRLANVYFEHIHPIYGFLSRDAFNQKALEKWSKPGPADDFDLVCCGVVALGSLFLPEPSHVQEADLVEHAKTTLEGTVKFPTTDRIAAWILRTLYLRLTTRPHIAWISSCVTMQLIEVTGIHQDVLTISVVHPPTSPMAEQDVELSRRLFWVARSLNAFISYENGYSFVHLPGVTCKPIAPENNTFTHELTALYSAWENTYSMEMVPEHNLEDFLGGIEAVQLHHDGLVLTQTNLAFCVYRRLRLRNTNFSKKGLDMLIAMGNAGLKASNKMLQSNLPWWHLAMVPFQYVCVLLAIDSRDSLYHVGNAMSTLEAVTQLFDTHVMREALMTAALLVREWKKRKEEDISFLDVGLSHQQTNTLNQLDGVLQTGANQPAPFEWPANINLNIPDTTDINWDLFLGGPSTLL